ncbi:MAG TPA: hypothetical protein VLJ76_10130 [Gaiellaceae bacterium]|nr:hypothetical protein [Gaiellaceae bacterium]
MKNGWKHGYRGLVVAVAALAVAGSAVAVAGAASHGKGKAAKRHAVARTVRAGVHADVSLVRADGSTDAFSVDRGKVTASTSTSLTLVRPDGKTVNVSVASTTIVRGTITVGRGALVFSRNGAAFRVAAPGPRALQMPTATTKSPVVHLQVSFVRADGSTGSVTLDRGQVTSSSAGSLTVKRLDGKSVTFTIGSGAVVRGKLAVGGKALVFSRGGTAFRILARAGA